MKCLYGLLPIIILLCSCSPRVSQQIVNKQALKFDAAQIKVLTENEAADSAAKFLGYLKAGEGLYHEDCEYENLLTRLKTTAGNSGANLLKITKKEQRAGCYRIWAEIYFDKSLDSKPKPQKEIKTIIQEREGQPDLRQKVVTLEGKTIAILEVEEVAVRLKQPWRMNLELGYSYRIARLPEGIPSNTKSLIQSLKHGTSYGADLIYLVNNKWGLGMRLHQSHARAATTTTLTLDDGTQIPANREMRNYISFLGLGYSDIEEFGNNLELLSSVYLGVLEYNSEDQVLNSFVTLRGYTIGMHIDVKCSYWLSKNMAISAMMGYQMGTMTSFTVNNGFRERKMKLRDGAEGLNQITAGAALTFRW